MTFQELQVLCSTWLDDVDNGYFTLAQVKVWLNNAQREVQKLLLNAGEDYYTVCSYTTSVINQKNYAFPSDFVKCMRLEKILQGSGDTAYTERLFRITRNEQDLIPFRTNGDPTHYIVNKSTFSLLPVPNVAKTIRLYYAYRVEDMVNNSDEPDCPEDYHEYIAIMAARDGFLKDGRDMGPIERKLGYFEKMLKENAEQRTQDAPREVVSTGMGFSDW